MDLQEELVACKADRDHYKAGLESSDVERVALDQMFVEALKNEIKLRKELLTLNKTINDLRNEIISITKQKQELQEFIDATALVSHAVQSNII